MTTCPTKKICYPTEKDAQDALWVIQFWGVAWWQQQRVYQCKLCGEWHLTSKPYSKNPGKKETEK